jgi:hypothetical protein
MDEGRSLKIYVAASSQEIPRAQRAMRSLRAAGHAIVGDWTVPVLARGYGGDANRQVPPAERRSESMACLKAVTEAEAVLLLAPETRSCGCWVELGYALAERQRRPELLVCSAGDVKQSIFCQLTHAFGTDDGALSFFEHLAGVRGAHAVHVALSRKSYP